MAIVSYGTITITDTNDIESIIIEYARNQDPSNAPSSGWSTDRPAWAQGYYIWQRTRTHKAGTPEDTDIPGTAVCITGSTGATGAAGRSLSSTVTHYTIATSSATINQGNMGSYTWTTNVPSYNASYPTYWVRVTNTYSNPSSTEYIFYKDQGITDAVKTSHDANTTAGQAKTAADEAKEIAQQTSTDVTNLQTRTKYFWTNLTAHTNGSGGWTKPNYPVGTFAASGISGTTFDSENSNTYGYNTLYSNGIKLRYNAINLGELTGSNLIFYNPSTSSQGTKAMELSGSSLKFYASDGATAQAEFGGSLAKVSGQLIAQSGYIGTNETNRWFIGNRKNYDQTNSAALVSYGNAYIQLGEDGCWRLSTNRLHTGWNAASGSNVLHYPKWNNIYWDFGIHAPTQNANKFIYIRNYDSTDSGYTEAQVLQDLQDNFESNVSVVDSWQYRFYVTAEGSLYAKNIYVLDDNGNATQIGGTDGVYLLKSGGTITGNLEVNGTLTKGGKNVAYLTATPTNGQILIADGTTGGIKTSSYTIATSVPSNAVFTDYRVRTDARNSTTMYLTGSNNTGTVSQGTLLTDSGVYIQTSNSTTNLVVPKVNGYTLAAAAAKGVDTSMTSMSTSTNLPTTKAVADLIATYLPLVGGTISGAVDINDELYADSATFGNLIVNGSASFTNNLQVNTINGVAVGNSPKFTDTVTTVTVTGTGNAITSASATNGAVTLTKGATFLTSYTETDPIFTASAAHGITSSDISNWNSKTSNTGTVTSVRVQASSPLQSSTSTAQSATLNTTISFVNQNANTVLAGPASGSTAAAPTFRKLVAADIPDISGTYYLASNPSGYTTNTGTVTSVKVQGSNGLTGSGTVTTSGTITLSHSDTSSQASSSNSGRTYIQSITLDTYGHVTGLSTATETVTNTHNTAYLYAGASNGSANAETTNGNTYLILVDGGSVTTRRKISGSGAATVTSDSSGNIAINAPTSLTGVSFDSGTITFSKSDGTTVPITTSDFVITQASGATALVRLKSGTTDEYEGYAAGGATTKPVYFDSNGHPVAVTSIPYSLLSDAPSSMTPKSHTHGNIQNGGTLQTNDITIANNDQLIVTDSSDSNKIARTSVKFDGSTTTKALTPKGTWETFATSNTNTTYTLTNALASHKFTWTFTAGGSGSGSTTTALELVQGSNITLTDDTTNKKVTIAAKDTTYSAGTGLSLTGTTFANAGVTGVKGNAESTYRTGQVNLTAANIGAVAKVDELLTTNPFAPTSLKGPYISKIDNALYCANKRWTVTATNYSGDISTLFDGNYDNVITISNGNTSIITIDFSNEETGYFPGYPYGYFLLSFYYAAVPTSVSCRVYCNYQQHGVGWHNITVTKVFDSGATNTVYRSDHQGYYQISKIEFTIVGDTTNDYGNTQVGQIEMHLDRPSPLRNPFLSKYNAETLYYDLTAPKFIGNLQGKADKVGDATCILYPMANNEINFGGTAAKNTIYFGYRTTDNQAAPTKYVFSGSTGTANLQCNKVYLSSGTSAYIDGTNYTGTAAIATNVSTEAGTTNSNRHVWFSHASTETKRAHDDDFTYNPATNTLSIGKVSATLSNNSHGEFTASRGNIEVWFGIGSANENHGVYSTVKNDWIVYANATGAVTLNGNAATATKLETARTIQINLASTSSASFDGTSNVTPGVTGTLAIANGGTGTTTFTSGSVLIGNGTNAIQTRAITNVTSGAVTASTNLVTANSLVSHVSNALGNYVTIAGDNETVTGTKVFNNLLGTKYVATKGGNGCEINYNSSLEALVFSFS